MPRSKSSPARSAGSPPAKSAATAGKKSSGSLRTKPEIDTAASARERADALYRAALECCRQHERYSRVVTSEVEAGEERAVSRVVGLCDDHVRAALDAYERAAAGDNGAPQDEWHRSANALGLASRDWIRRRAQGEDTSRRLMRRTPEKLGELAVEYDLAASAMLALQQALEAYRRVAPEADLKDRGRT